MDVHRAVLVLDLTGVPSTDAAAQIRAATGKVKVQPNSDRMIHVGQMVDNNRILIVSSQRSVGSGNTYAQEAQTYLNALATENPALYQSLQFVVCTSATDLQLNLKLLLQTDYNVPMLPFDTNALVRVPGRTLEVDNGKAVFTSSHDWTVIAGAAQRKHLSWLQGIRRSVGPNAQPALAVEGASDSEVSSGSILLMGSIEVQHTDLGFTTELEVAVEAPADLNLFAGSSAVDAGRIDNGEVCFGTHRHKLPAEVAVDYLESKLVRAGLREESLRFFHADVDGKAIGERLKDRTLYVRLPGRGGDFVALPHGTSAYADIMTVLVAGKDTTSIASPTRNATSASASSVD